MGKKKTSQRNLDENNIWFFFYLILITKTLANTVNSLHIEFKKKEKKLEI